MLNKSTKRETVWEIFGCQKIWGPDKSGESVCAVYQLDRREDNLPPGSTLGRSVISKAA